MRSSVMPMWDANPAALLFIEVDGLGAGELEDSVLRSGGVKAHLGGDMPLDIGVQGIAVGEVAEVSACHRHTRRPRTRQGAIAAPSCLVS